MKPITEAFTKLNDETLKELAERLKIKSSSEKQIVASIQTVSGIQHLLQYLTNNELKLLKKVYASENGVTFSEIEKELQLSIPQIDELTRSLSKMLLIYSIKNRQLINNKLDKAYGILELSSFINIVEEKEITGCQARVVESLQNKTVTHVPPEILKDEHTRKFIETLVNAGFILTYEEVTNFIQKQHLNDTINLLLNKHVIIIYQTLSDNCKTYILLNEKMASHALHTVISQDSSLTTHVHNKYFFILNLFNAYDTISTHGLFLTKQQEFRKIDLRRISDSMITMHDIEGRNLSSERTAQLSLHMLYRLNCLTVEKDIASISLGEIQKINEFPHKIVQKIIKKLDETDKNDPVFQSPIELPSMDYIMKIITILEEQNILQYRSFIIMLLASSFSLNGKHSIHHLVSNRNIELHKIIAALNLLVILGIIEVNGSSISLSDVGFEIASSTLKAKPEGPEAEQKKCIYINPDFTIIIPTKEVSSLTLYHLLTHTEIIQKDVTINTLISKGSIVKAHKLGMQLKKFVETLKDFSKNDLPQNLSFLLTEWSNQTLNIKISNTILLTASHASFIDEIAYSRSKGAIIEKISPTHAIISRDHIDEIVKLAKKKDALITLFPKDESEL